MKRGERPASEPGPAERLQVRLGVFVKSRALLRQALMHPSAADAAGLGRAASYERMEFLGDSLLNFAVANILWERFPDLPEGDLTKLRAYWVSGPILAGLARDLGVPEALELGTGEARRGDQHRDRVLASVLEALLAAVYLDSGWGPARNTVRRLLLERIVVAGTSVLLADHKTVLQERRQALGLALPEYRTEASGEGFRCNVLLDGEARGVGEGRSRKAAEQAAAADALGGLKGSE